MNQEKAPASDFIREAVKEDLAAGGLTASTRGFRPSPTATCTSVTPRPSASTSAWRPTSAGSATCASTTPTRPRRTGIRRCHRARHPLAGLRLAGPALLRQRLLRPHVRLGRAVDPGGGGLRLRPVGRRGLGPSRHAHRPGKDSPYRNRAVAENLDLFRRMRAGEFPDGSRTLRAKIDMACPT